MSFDLELINNDVKLKADGTIRTITDTPKLRQDIIKILMTELGTNKFHPWYGCTIGDSVGKNLPDSILEAQVRSSVSQSLERLRSLQRKQSATQQVSLAEIIDVIAQITIERDIVDRRQLNIVVSVISKRITKVEEIFTLIA